MEEWNQCNEWNRINALNGMDLVQLRKANEWSWTNGMEIMQCNAINGTQYKCLPIKLAVAS